MRNDYETYSGDVLERYFKTKLFESLAYRDIGSWWDPKGYTDGRGNHQQCEIDIVALPLEKGTIEFYEVKRNKEKYKAGLLEEKVAHLTAKVYEARVKRPVLGCLSMEDM